MGKGRECAESCIDYLALELVHHYRAQQQGPTLQVRWERGTQHTVVALRTRLAPQLDARPVPVCLLPPPPPPPTAATSPLPARAPSSASLPTCRVTSPPSPFSVHANRWR